MIYNEFKGETWKKEINVRDFIVSNYTQYDGDELFLAVPTKRTLRQKERLEKLLAAEFEKGGVLDIDTSVQSALLSYSAGYLDKKDDIIVGLQTDAPLKRGIDLFGGIRMGKQAAEAYGYKVNDELLKQFEYRTTHNDAVFKVYTDEMRAARSSHILSGLPDSYGRGRLIGDYRRVALYGVDFLIEQKKNDKQEFGKKGMDDENVRTLKELAEQIDALTKLKEMAMLYGIDISKPATNSREAVQWLYFGYLGSVKEQNGAANSMGRISAFLDIYFERDLKNKTITEEQIQEIIDDFVIKLRMVRHLRTPDYNVIFAGDPYWVTLSEGGATTDGKHMITKTNFRILNTLYNLGSSAEPNITILWSKHLPEAYKRYCARVSIETDSLQYENDDLMRKDFGDDYGIACCVSAMKLGKQQQYFGARCNLPKLLLLALNGGKDEIGFKQLGPEGKVFDGELKYNEVIKAYREYSKWLAKLYVNTMNAIHYMHDRYAYERLTMALHDTQPGKLMAFGVSGLSVIVDSLSAIKYAKVTPIKNEQGIIVDFKIEGNFPKFGNDDNRVDKIAKEITKDFYSNLKQHKLYRDAIPTLSVLTITSNVMYGKGTGNTPDGRKMGEPFAPGANPMHGRDSNGAVCSLNSVAKIDYCNCQDGISNTMSVVPSVLGTDLEIQKQNLVALLDGYFAQKAHHLNVNVLNRELLIDAMENPTKYPNLTIRVSGYAVNFNRLTQDQKQEVISRTFHTKI